MAAHEENQAGDQDAVALMSLLQSIDVAGTERATMQLDLRAKRLIQTLGVHGPEAVTVVAHRLGVTKSTMTGVVDRVARMGYVRRLPHPEDRRASVLELTRDGEEVFAAETAFYRRLIDRTLEPLDDPARASLLEALRSLPGTTDQ